MWKFVQRLCMLMNLIQVIPLIVLILKNLFITTLNLILTKSILIDTISVNCTLRLSHSIFILTILILYQWKSNVQSQTKLSTSITFSFQLYIRQCNILLLIKLLDQYSSNHQLNYKYLLRGYCRFLLIQLLFHKSWNKSLLYFSL
jgi:hypothetical protein